MTLQTETTPQRILQETARLTALSFASSDEAIDAALAVMSRLLESRTLFLARFDEGPGGERILNVLRVRDNNGIPLRTGSAGTLPQTYCNSVSVACAPVIIEDTHRDPAYADLPSTTELGIRSYVGVPLVYSTGRIYGTLCGIDAAPAVLADRPEVVEFLQILARFLISQIERDETTARLRDMINLHGRFTAVIAHDLRAPLTSILGATQLLLRKGDALEAETAQRWGRQIERSARRMVGQVNDLLAYTRGSMDNVTVTLESQALEVLIGSAIETMEAQAEAKGIALTSTIARQAASVVLVDEGQMHRILQNLLANALKFTPHGGYVTVVATEAQTRGGHITLHPDPFPAPDAVPWVIATMATTAREARTTAHSATVTDGSWTAISVVDDGIGIAAADVPTIFDEYRQVRTDEHAPRAGEGVGLGLAIVQQLISLMGGYVAVRSFPARGSCFTVLLPRIDTDEQL